VESVCGSSVLSKYSKWRIGCSGAQSARQTASIGVALPWSLFACALPCLSDIACASADARRQSLYVPDCQAFQLQGLMSVTCYYRMRVDGITLYLVLIFSGAAGQAIVPLRLPSNVEGQMSPPKPSKPGCHNFGLNFQLCPFV
jgi:hypothetical protein